MSRGKKQSDGPALVGSLLGRLVRPPGAPPAVDAELWRRAVGPRIAARSAPGSLSKGTLTVRVASPTWAQELSLLSDEIRRRLGEAGVAVESVRFRVDGRAGAETGAVTERQPPRPPVPLPPELAARIDAIDDPELRRVMTRAARYSLAQAAAPPLSAPPLSAPPRAARAPRAAGARSDRPARARPESTGGTRRSRGDRRG